MSRMPQPEPWIPAPYTPADVAAIQALARGNATPDQQQRAIDWIIRDAAKAYELDYRTESRDHAFSSGRRFVGLQIISALKLDVAKLRKVDD